MIVGLRRVVSLASGSMGVRARQETATKPEEQEEPSCSTNLLNLLHNNIICTTWTHSQHHTTFYLRCCAGWQPGVAHLQFCITKRRQFDGYIYINRGRREGLYWAVLVLLWSQPGSEEAQPLQLWLLSSLGQPLLWILFMVATGYHGCI